MKIFNANQIKAWDEFSISEQGIKSFDLMYRASNACYEWLLSNHLTNKLVHIFCGKGNNGGDGLTLARILIENGFPVQVYILETGKPGTEDFQESLQQLHHHTSQIHFIQPGFSYPSLDEADLIIDALFGTGLNKPLDGISSELVQFLNNTSSEIISIDIPSGLFPDKSCRGFVHITATHTLCFQNLKLPFLFPENEAALGKVHLVDIGLSLIFELEEPTAYEMPGEDLIRGIIRPENKFAHKGERGHAALIAGSHGMMGAAVLAARACLGTGAGKLTCYVPACGVHILQISVPEAICKVDGEKFPETTDNMQIYSAIGIGPGISVKKNSAEFLRVLFLENTAALLLDADALNCIAENRALLKLIPGGTIITPHPKEFDRLFGKAENDFARLQLAVEQAAILNIYIVLKGHYSAIITPLGKVYFNRTGNSGMAKSGMGDVLSGIITGLMARHYPLPEAAILGVYLHGLAGDIAAEKYSKPSMMPTDLINSLGYAWKLLGAC